VRLAGIPLQVTSLRLAAQEFVDGLADRAPEAVRFVNAYSVALASRDAAYRAVLQGPGRNFPDGTPVARFVRGRAGLSREWGQVRGPSFFRLVLDLGRERSVRHFLLGGTPDSLADLRAAIEATTPGAHVVGSWAPPFGPVTDDLVAEAADRIRAVAPDVVWVAIGTPKQDHLAARLAHAAGVTAVGVGAAFDFLSGRVPEAPRLVQHLGLEWLFRLASEPRRLWRRYLFGNLTFLGEVLRTETAELVGTRHGHLG
jgi:N-acetylglucosaminyldiphosphoundecaprenol N-acetyl-beta-D-mannosaminyltransferase